MAKALDSLVVDFTLTDEVRDAIAAFEAQLVAPIHEHTVLANGVADCCACCDDVRAGNEIINAPAVQYKGSGWAKQDRKKEGK
jgi:predicted nucleic acid-binding Zn ribbon protein